MVENLEVEPGAASAKVIINSRTGTVVISSHVIVTPAAVSHGSLSVTIKEEQTVSQPNPFSKLGQTVVLNNSTIKVDQGSNRMFLFKPGVELGSNRARGERCRRRARRSGRHSGSTAGGRRAAGRAGRHLNDYPAAHHRRRCPRLGDAPTDTSAATTYTDVNGLAALKRDPNSPAGHQRRRATSRGAVSANDAEEHARRDRGRRNRQQRNGHVPGHVRQAGGIEHQPARRFRYWRAC